MKHYWFGNPKIIILVISTGVLLTLILFATTLSSPTVRVGDTKTGILVPLYRHPDSTWDDLIQVKNAHPSVPIIAIVNPDNGPGSWDPTYVLGIKKLQFAGIPVLGYVYTKYGARDTSEITANIDSYKNWYGVNGIFFDEMTHMPGKEGYYLHLNDYAKSIGLNFTIGNPGRNIPSSYLGTVDNIVIYENSGLPSVELLKEWHTKYSKYNFSILSYGVNNLDETFVQSISNHVGLIYITDETLPNPWYSLTSYLDKLATLLETTSDNKDLVSPISTQHNS